MHRSSPILSLVFLLFFTVSGSKAFSYTYDGKLPARVLCEDTSEIHMKVCADSFTLNDTTYYRDGIHTQTFINAAGCDSTVYLYLSLKVDKPVINVDSLYLGTTSYYETYQWYKNDTAIAGATDPLYNIGSREPACYSVVVNAAFCPDTSDYYCIKEDEVKVAEQSLQNRIKIYPNPTAGHLNLLSPTPVYTQISSPDGRIWQRNNDTKLSMESLPSGVYFIRITDLEGRLIKVEQVVKK